jgi:hypothetical protein
MNHMMEVTVQLFPDEEGFIGRECPEPECEGYFKILPGTGLKGENLPCHCPYCGFTGPTNQFWTKEQLEYIHSILLGKAKELAYKELKKLEFEHKPKGPFGIGISMKVERGAPVPIRYYRERRLETNIICDNCTLHYSVYGVFAFCPDCGLHNSLQILDKNLEVVSKMLDYAQDINEKIAERLVENALEDCISAFDGFGREICRVYAKQSHDSGKAEKIHFQNLESAKKDIQSTFGFDISASVTEEDWSSAVRSFQKRHLIAHKMGVVDEKYITKTKDPDALVGRKILISPEDVSAVMRVIREVGGYLADQLVSTE